MKIRISCQHGRELRLASVIKDMTRLSVFFSIGKFIAYSQRGAGTLPYQDITVTKPRRILIIYVGILLSLLKQIEMRTSYMLRKD